MKHILLSILILNIYSLIACDYTLHLHDTFGDGWNGNSVSLSVNGTVILDEVTFNTGADADFSFSANPGDLITITYNASGNFPSENEITIVSDDLGITLFSDGMEGSPSGGSVTVGEDCGIAPPDNDEPCGATYLPMNEDCSSSVSSLNGATSTNMTAPSCGNYNNSEDVWFETTVGESGVLGLSASSPTLNIAVYTGGSCDSLTEIMCYTGGYFVSDVAPGTPVWLRVWDNEESGGFNICVFEEPTLYMDTVTYTTQELIEEVLVTGCLEAYNVEYDGLSSAVGYFRGGMEAFGMSSGLVLATGNIFKLTGQSTDGENLEHETNNNDVENDLSQISEQNEGSSDMHDEAILEFDFVPSSDTTEFNFVFASKEYPTFEHSQFNDVFAFFVSGPGINGFYTDDAINVALVPGTNIPITITTINGNDNSEYFGAYTAGNPIPHFDVGGYTQSITAVMTGLTPCETYHIKFCIADAEDHAYPSYVFFEAGSFSSGGDVSMNSISNVGSASDIYEGCQNYYVFNRIDTTAEAMQDTVFVNLEVGGTATAGVDYTDVPDSLFILPNELSDTLYYTALFDDFQEGPEYIVFSLLNGCLCSQTSIQDTIWIKDNFHIDGQIDDDLLICEGEEIQINTQVNPDIDPILLEYVWNTGTPPETGTSITVSPTVSTTYEVTVTNICQNQEILTTPLTVVPTVAASFSLSTDTICKGEPVSITFTGAATQYAEYTWNDDDAYPSLLNTQGPHVTSWSSNGLKTILLNVNDRGCVDNASANIYVKEFSDLSLSTTQTDVSCFGQCDGSGTVLASSPNVPFTYHWENGQSMQTASGLCVGTYRVTVTDGYGCKDTSHISVGAPTEMTFNITTDSASCYGFSDGAIFVDINNGTPPYSFAWSNGANSQNNLNVLANNYTVTITDNNGCSKTSDDITVYQPNEIALSVYGTYPLNNQEWICKTQFDTLIASVTGGIDSYTYEWSTSESSSSIVVQPQETTNYWVQVTDSKGCKSKQKDITVNVYDDITIDTYLSSQSICKGEGIDVNIEAIGGNGQYIYSTEGVNGGVAVSNSFTIYPVQSQDLIITVTDNCGSPNAEEVIPIEVNPNPVITFSSDLQSGCEPLSVTFNETTETPISTYFWNFTNNKGFSSVSTVAKPVQVFEKSGSYDVSLAVTSDKGCSSSLKKPAYITVFDNPIAEFKADDENKSVVDRVVSFDNYSEKSFSYLWMFGDGDTSSQVNPVHEYPNFVQTYEVSLIAFSSEGCLDTLTQIINIADEPTLYSPTAFSPDGDGLNEIFTIKGNGIKEEDFSLVVYDRWGMILFETTNVKEGWNGKSTDGNFVSPGVYYWVLKYRDSNDIPREKNGVINLIR